MTAIPSAIVLYLKFGFYMVQSSTGRWPIKYRSCCAEKSKRQSFQRYMHQQQKMEGGGESDEIGREAHHGGAVQSGGEHKDSTDGDEDGKFQVQVYYYILVHF